MTEDLTRDLSSSLLISLVRVLLGILKFQQAPSDLNWEVFFLPCPTLESSLVENVPVSWP